jgi:phosphoadenosine phosphosulfate reductase
MSNPTAPLNTAPLNTALLSQDELDAANAKLEHAAPSQIIEWTLQHVAVEDLCIASSMADTVAVAIALQVVPTLEVVFLDTQYHFTETWDTVEAMRARFPEFQLRVMKPNVEPDDLWKTDLEGCCGVRKVEPLNRALAGKKGWFTGVRRSDAVTRTVSPIAMYDKRGILKVNPLATWTDDDVAFYAAEHNIPMHPLIAQGYPSIGCAPCTRKPEPGEDPRAGRWAGSGKVECGLHV